MDTSQFAAFLEQMQQQHREEMQLLREQLAAQGQHQQPAAAAPGAAYPLHKQLSDRMEKFFYNSEAGTTFETYYDRYQVILETEAATLTEAQRVQLMTEKLSTEDYSKFADTILPRKVANIPFTDAVSTLKRIFGKKESQFSLRYKCIKMRKLETENYADYAARVNLKCEKSKLADGTADDIKVLIFIQGLVGVQDSHALEKLLVKLDEEERKIENAVQGEVVRKMDLNDVASFAERLSNLKEDKSLVKATQPSEVNAVQKSVEKRDGKQDRKKERPQVPKTGCWHCKAMHWSDQCPSKPPKCPLCGRFHAADVTCAQHTEQVIKRKRGDPRRRSNQILSASITTRKHVTPTINGQKLALQLDSASDWTIISRSYWEALGCPKLRSCMEQAVSASGDKLKMLGYFTGCLSLHGREATGNIYVSKFSLNLLGSDWMENLGLFDVPINVICNATHQESTTAGLKAKYPEVFKAGLGFCTKEKAKLTLRRDAPQQCYRKARPLPFAKAQIVEKELLRLQQMGVIEPITHSEWAAPIVVVQKSNGKIRVTADYSTGLNNALEPNMHPLPTPEEIFSQLAGSTVFSKLDLSDAYLQVELDDEAKKLMSINTHVGLFKVNRLQPGVKPATGIFQSLSEKMLAGVKGTLVFLDDITVHGKTKEGHDQSLDQALKRIQEYGLRLQAEKCSFRQSSIEFLGSIIDKDGRRPSPVKLKTLQEIPAPKDIQQLQAFLGAVTWYSTFVPNMKDLRGPLDELLRKNVEFKWLPAHQSAFVELKKALSSDMALTHYDPTKKIIVAADASSYGMGAVLMHAMPDGTEKPVIHVASSFNAAEKNYPQVQREALALKFAVTKFHRYIFGRHFELRTDHKPLLAVFGSKSGIPVYTINRLQRYALTLLAYDFTIKYINTESFAYADFISRLMAKQTVPNEDVVIATISEWGTAKESETALQSRCDAKRELDIQIKAEQAGCFEIDTVMTLPVTFDALKKETEASEAMKGVAEHITNGWPQKKDRIEDPEVASFYAIRNSLSIISGCIFHGDRVVIPSKHRKAILNELHDGHPGIQRMKLLARMKCYWPKMCNDIESYVRTCNECSEVAPAPRKCLLKPWPTPAAPWTRLHIDYAGPISGFWYLVIVDALSNWPEIFKVTATTSTKTIECLVEEAFARQGLCKTIVSDNGRQFVSNEFRVFCEHLGIKHLFSAPYHPQSNGRAERFVGILKRALEKLGGTSDAALRKFLFCYRRTPSETLGGSSPFKIMSGRDMQSRLDLIKPSGSLSVNQNTEMAARSNRHHGAMNREFFVGEQVHIQLGVSKKWTEATVTKRKGAVDYQVILGDGRIVHSHANQMKRRYTNIDERAAELLNEFSGEFDIELPQQIAPNIVPVQDRNEDNDSDEEEDAFQDARAGDEPESEEEEEPQLRRSGRANAGVPPRYLNENYDLKGN